MTYAFTFDASACTGCKACQVACKDKNNLPEGVLWRRVFEISGGGWIQTGGAWENSVFAYNLSIACNHCIHPKCAGVCPTDAYIQREDGIVYIDSSKCMGCGYCAWACPYGVPQYNPELRHMTKCNFCLDEVDQGKSPVCVAACPMRVLDFVQVTSNQGASVSGDYQALWEKPASEHPFPMPEFSRTQPHLMIKPHPAIGNDLQKVISNREEVRPLPSRASDELPLVAFTLLAQMSAGMAVGSLVFKPGIFNLLAIGLLLGVAGLISFLHLKTKKNAWRAVMHLQKSWLSREILMAGLFGVVWLVWFAEYWFLNTNYFLALTALLGIALVYSMSQVYRLKAAPAWNTWRTEAAFFLSTGTLGLSGVALAAGMVSLAIPLLFLLLAEAGMVFSEPDHLAKTANRLRLGLILLALVGVGAVLFVTEFAQGWVAFLIFFLVFFNEILGRWVFYEARPSGMH